MMSERDAIAQMKVTRVNENQNLYISTSIEKDEYPLKKEYIRMRFYDATLVEVQGDDLKMIKFSNFDLGGNFPVRLLNMIMASSQEKMAQGLYDKIKA